MMVYYTLKQLNKSECRYRNGPPIKCIDTLTSGVSFPRSLARTVASWRTKCFSLFSRDLNSQPGDINDAVKRRNEYSQFLQDLPGLVAAFLLARRCKVALGSGSEGGRQVASAVFRLREHP